MSKFNLKIFAALMVMALVLAAFAGCGGDSADDGDIVNDDMQDAEAYVDPDPDPGFEFSLSYLAGYDKVDTFTEKLTLDGIGTVDYKMTNAEKAKILESFIKNDIESVPADISTDFDEEAVTTEDGITSQSFSAPSISYKLKYKYDGKEGSIVFDNVDWFTNRGSANSKIAEKRAYQDAFLAFANTVLDIVESSDTYKDLPLEKHAMYL